MSPGSALAPKLLAFSDLHVAFPENRKIVEDLRPESAADWLLLAGDVGGAVRRHRVGAAHAQRAVRDGRVGAGKPRAVDAPATIRCSCAARSDTGTWWSCAAAWACITPEDPYPVWDGAGGPVTIAPLFVLYDYTFLPAGAAD